MIEKEEWQCCVSFTHRSMHFTEWGWVGAWGGSPDWYEEQKTKGMIKLEYLFSTADKVKVKEESLRGGGEDNVKNRKLVLIKFVFMNCVIDYWNSGSCAESGRDSDSSVLIQLLCKAEFQVIPYAEKVGVWMFLVWGINLRGRFIWGSRVAHKCLREHQVRWQLGP